MAFSKSIHFKINDVIFVGISRLANIIIGNTITRFRKRRLVFVCAFFFGFFELLLLLFVFDRKYIQFESFNYGEKAMN